MNIQYGSGNSCPENWINFDSSPALKLQRLPLLSGLFKSTMKFTFPNGTKYGNIVTGLPVVANCADLLYCSHVLEHLTLNDFRIALKNSHTILKNGGTFRIVLPDLRYSINRYIKNTGSPEASILFMEETLLGKKSKPKTIRGVLSSLFGGAAHLWMWDKEGIINELKVAGFTEIRECRFNDSKYIAFKDVENESRFNGAIALECTK